MKNEQTRKETIGIDEAARTLGIGRSLAYKLAKQGSLGPIPVIRVGRRLLVPKQALEKVLRGDFSISGGECNESRAQNHAL